MRYGIAFTLLLAAQTPSSSSAFLQQSTSTFISIHCPSGATNAPTSADNDNRRSTFRHGVSAYAPAEDGSSDSLGGANATSTGLYLTNLVTDAVQSADDAEEIELAERRRKISERSGTYRVTLPLTAMPKSAEAMSEKTVSQTPTIMGFSIRQFSTGGDISNKVLNLDTLAMETVVIWGEKEDTESPENNVETISVADMKNRLDRSISGVYVCRVQKGGPAWESGIRPGDVLTSTAATFGDAFWPKTTLEGVRSAITSRRMVAGSAGFEFRRTDVPTTDNLYELSIKRPIGLNLRGKRETFIFSSTRKQAKCGRPSFYLTFCILIALTEHRN